MGMAWRRFRVSKMSSWSSNMVTTIAISEVPSRARVRRLITHTAQICIGRRADFLCIPLRDEGIFANELFPGTGARTFILLSISAAPITEDFMATKPTETEPVLTRERLAELLNGDLAREYQAIIAYVVYSQVLKGAEYMNIADQLQIHAKQELDHALTISRQIDYLGTMPTVTPGPVKTSDKARDMLRFDLDQENETIRNYRERVRQCEALGEFALAEQIRQILVEEQDHQIDLATALGEEVPDLHGRGPQRRRR
jgi:bacterioferritin